MDRFYIITNSDKDPSMEITGKIVDYLKEYKNTYHVEYNDLTNHYIKKRKF